MTILQEAHVEQLLSPVVGAMKAGRFVPGVGKVPIRKFGGGNPVTTHDLANSLKRRGVELWYEGERLRFRAPKDAFTAEQREGFPRVGQKFLAQLRADAANEDLSPFCSVSGRCGFCMNRHLILGVPRHHRGAYC